MKRHRSTRMLSVFLTAIVALVLTVAAPAGWAKSKVAIPFETAKIIFEFNSSGPDLGIQITLDGEPWNKITIVDPNGRTIFDVQGKGVLKKFGLTELFVESNEPNFADMSKEEILDLFPEGEYKFSGTTVEGDSLVGTATLTHNIPDGPVIVSPTPSTVVGTNLVITWNAVTTPAGINIVSYQVIVGSFQVTVPATSAVSQSVTVPPEFVGSLAAGLQPFEVLAIEAGGNQTITEGSFTKQ
jgi:hypothetical protein